jgi:ABC-type oligopeptide transport system substrate-binding subunit
MTRIPGARLLGAALLLGAAPAPAPAAPVPKVTVVVSALNTLDPAQVVNAAEERAVAAVFEGLTVLAPGKPEGVSPGAAGRWETSADGLVWTFHLRPEAKWTDGQPVAASDFVETWRRLLHPETKSPHAHQLDVLQGAKELSRDHELSERLYRLAGQLKDLVAENRAGLSSDDAITFVNDTGFRTATAHMTDPSVVKLHRWKEDDPMTSGVAKAAQAALEKEAKALRDRYDRANARVGKDQGWFARDERTLVVQTVAPAPYLPRLLSHPSLVPLARKTREARRGAFDGYNLVCNGAYVSKGPMPGGDVHKLVLERNPAYWNAATVPTERIEVWTDIDDAIRRFQSGEAHWLAHNLGSLGILGRGSLDADRLVTLKKEFPSEYYETPSGTVYVLRFRCDQPPMDDKKVRQAVAAALDRVGLLAQVRGPKPAPIHRLVPPAVHEAPPDPGAPGWAKPIPAGETAAARTARLAGAKALLSAGKLEDGVRLLYLADEALEPAMIALSRVFDEALGLYLDRRVLDTSDDYQSEIDKGLHHALLSPLRPDYDDPLAYLETWTSGHPEAQTGWSSPAYDALIAGVRDPAAFAKTQPEAAMKALSDPGPVKSACERAKTGDAAARAALRASLLQAAERMLLEEAVVVPLWLATEAGVVRPGLRGLDVKGERRSVVDYHPLTTLSFEAP